MARTLKGTLWVATALAASKAFTTITNAAEPELASAAHGFSVGDHLLVRSGWSKLDYKVVRVKTVTTDTYTIEGIDTTSTSDYPAGQGAGSVQKVTGYTEVTKVLENTPSGGDAKEVTLNLMDEEDEVVLHDGFSAVKRVVAVDADTIGTPGYELVKTLTHSQAITVMKMVARTGATQLTPCRLAMNEEEVAVQNAAAVRFSVSAVKRSTRFSS